MEPIENLFSSPAKSDHEDQELEEEEEEDEYGSGEEAMDITTSTHSPEANQDVCAREF
jgi:centromere protein C